MSGAGDRVDPPWTEGWQGAACAGVDPELWFASDWRAKDQAKRICATCPIKRRCEDWALTHREFGIWGGMDEADRMFLRPNVYLNTKTTDEPVLPLFQGLPL